MVDKSFVSAAKRFAAGALLLLTALVFPLSAVAQSRVSGIRVTKDGKEIEPRVTNTLKVLFTGDLHSCAERYPQLIAFIKAERAKAESLGYEVVTLDAGGISFGSIYSALTEIDAAEYRALAMMGCDAYVFGDRDFDLGVTPLAYMFYNAHVGKKDVDPVTGKKLEFPANVTGNVAAKEGDKIFGNAMKYIRKSPYIILTKGKMKVGILGLLGKKAYNSVIPKDDFRYEDPLKIAKLAVDELKAKKVDYIICLYHGGASSKENSEPALLARECPDIDLIVAAHDHEALFAPYMVGNSAIVAAGANGQLVGDVSLSQQAKKNPVGYELKSVPLDIEPDKAGLALLDSLDTKVAGVFARKYRCFPYDVVSFDFKGMAKGVAADGSNPIACEIAKSMYNAVAFHSKAGADTSLLVSLVPGKIIKAAIPEGPLSYAEVFRVLPLGRDIKGNLGYPVVLTYFTGKELKLLCEMNASASDMNPEHSLALYGLSYTYDPAAMKFFKVRKVAVHGKEIDEKGLYPVVSDQNTIRELSVLGENSHGIFSFEPKDANGKPVKAAKDIMVKSLADAYMPTLYMSQWFCLAQYIKNKAVLPDLGPQPAGTVDHSFIFAYGKPALIFVVALALICGSVLAVSRIRKARKRKGAGK